LDCELCGGEIVLAAMTWTFSSAASSWFLGSRDLLARFGRLANRRLDRVRVLDHGPLAVDQRLQAQRDEGPATSRPLRRAARSFVRFVMSASRSARRRCRHAAAARSS
jgi:hypothetical protein